MVRQQNPIMGHFKGDIFHQARLAQSVETLTTYLKVVSSSPNVRNEFSF